MRVVSLGVGGLMLAMAAGAAVPSVTQAQRRSRDRITREEILKSAFAGQDLHAAIKALRPHFLQPPRARSMGSSRMSPLAVYVDRVRQSGVDMLLQIRANTIEEARYLDPVQSETDYGGTANGGAIVIKLYQGDKPDSAAKKPPR